VAERRWGSPHDQHSQRPDSTSKPLIPHPGEGERSSEWTHEELVQGFRHLIDTTIQERLRGKDWYDTKKIYPAGIIRDELVHQSLFAVGNPDNKLLVDRSRFYSKIKDAWDVIAFDHYRERDGVVSYFVRDEAFHYLSLTYQIAKDKEEPRPEIITLDPLQAKILDALAEAAGVPHQQGQTEIEIPEHLRGHREYQQWLRAERGQR
jgi:hypothetical protein